MIPLRGDHPVHGHFWVPIDDDNNWAWSFDYRVTKPAGRAAQVKAMQDGKGIACLLCAGASRSAPRVNKDNDYLMDRAAQKAGRTYSGVWGIAMQDASLQESMGPIVDRTKENLVSTDNGIIMARHRLLRATKALIEKGTIPPGVDVAHQQYPFGCCGAAARPALQGRRQGRCWSPRPACAARIGVTKYAKRKRPRDDGCRGTFLAFAAPNFTCAPRGQGRRARMRAANSVVKRLASAGWRNCQLLHGLCISPSVPHTARIRRHPFRWKAG